MIVAMYARGMTEKCLACEVRQGAVVRNEAIYLALGVRPDGARDILGLWIENIEGAKFW